jgi:hypothetical protein
VDRVAVRYGRGHRRLAQPVIERQVETPDAYPDLERLIYAPLVDERAGIALTPEAQ